MTFASEMLRRLAEGETTSRSLTEASLASIAEKDADIKAFIKVAPDALAQADRSDARRRSGRAGALEGLPVAIKDNIDVAGLPTTDGTGFFAGRMAQRDANVVRRLRAAGAVILGKLNMHECALGATNDNPFWGRCQNPRALGFTPGGSSGGSAAAVAAGYVSLALGTDTMGSVRIPAAYCGLWGLKPTRGLIGRGGLSPLSWMLDTIGPIAADADGLTLALSVLQGVDDGDPDSCEPPTADVAPPLLRGLRLGVVDLAKTPIEPAVEQAFAALCARLSENGAVLKPVTIEGWRPTVLRRAGLLASESELAFRLAADLDSGAPGFSPSLRSLLAYGRQAPATKLAEAYDHLRTVRPALLAAMRDLDALVLPTAPQRAFAHGTAPPPTQADFTALANAVGLPAVAFPIAAPDAGLPASAQLLTRPFRDASAIALAKLMAETSGDA